jgi:hypothetical protein
MNRIVEFFAGLGLVWLAFIFVGFIAWVQGIYMVFHASLALGIISIFFEVPYVMESVVYWITGYNIAAHLAVAFGM